MRGSLPKEGGLQSGAPHDKQRFSEQCPDTFHYGLGLEKEMATHSSVLAWRIPGIGEPGGLPSLGSHGVGHDGSDIAAAVAETWEGKGFVWGL